MAQPTQSTCTLQEEDKIIDVKQGGCYPWGLYCTPYCAYDFVPRERKDKELFNITYDVIEHFSKNRVVMIDCQYGRKKNHKKPFFKDWIPPEYIEDGMVNEFKQYLIQSDRKDLIWTDYMRYVSKNINFFFFPTEIRDYCRKIYILQEKLDLELLKMAGEYSYDNKKREAGIVIFPGTEIKYLSDTSKTIESYVNTKDNLIVICMDEIFHDITITPNPRYITYDQLLEEIKPIFEKHGWKLGNTENPYIKALQCDVNCPECDETQCPHYMKGKNPRVDQTYYKVEVD